MTPKEIKRILFDRDLTISDLARRWGKRREEVSYCVNQLRVYQEIRELLSEELGIPTDKLFPAAKSRSRAA